MGSRNLAAATTLCAVALVSVALGGAGCADIPRPSRDELIERQYDRCELDLPGNPLAHAVCEAWRAGRDAGESAGAEAAAKLVAKRTRDGYRLRSLAALIVAGAGAWFAGATLLALSLALLRRRRRHRLGEHLRATMEREADLIRELGAGGDALARGLYDRIASPLGALEQQAYRLADECRRLERHPGDPTRKAHLESVARRLEQMVGRVESVRIRIAVWREQLDTVDETELEGEIAETIEDLDAALEEVA